MAEFVGKISWNFKFNETNPVRKQQQIDTVKRKIYKYCLKYPKVYGVHRNGNITMTSFSNDAEEAVRTIGKLLKNLARSYNYNLEIENELREFLR